nr:uncharacterized protein LOC113828586 [Penaeus vannamei]
MEALRKHGVCFCCLQIGHTSKNWPNKRFCELKGDGKEMCNRLQHPVLHDLFSRNNAVLLMNNMISREGILLVMSFVKNMNMDIPTLWDSGSNISMITHRMARRLGLKGNYINLSVTKIGNESRNLSSKIYKVPLVDAEGNLWEIEACGIMEITSEVPKFDLSKVLDILDASELKIRRPWGKIELLIGTDYAGIMPIVLKTVGNFQLMKNAFGYCIRESFLSELMFKLNGVIIRVNHSNCSYKVEEIDIMPLKGIGKQIDFLSVEGLCVQCSPKCGECKCGKCPLIGEYTLKEERELLLIKEGLKYNVKEKCFHVTYPFVKDPNNLPNNYYAAKARLQSLENRLKRNGADYTQKYCDQVNDDMISRGVARKLSQGKLETYKGPVFYLPHHEVMKPESESTPLRIVFNSSASYMGISLNDCLAKGPDILTNMMGMLLRFRQYPVAVVGDKENVQFCSHISNGSTYS